MESRVARALGLLVVGSVLAACATPRVITQISLSEDTARMIYAQTKTLNTGLIECQVAPDGTLKKCREIPITFVEK